MTGDYRGPSTPARKRGAPPLRMTRIPRLPLRLGVLRRPLAALLRFRFREHSRHPRTAVRTASILQLVRHHGVPRPRDHRLLAAGADRVRTIGVDVALINVLQSHLERDPPRAVQRLRRSCRLVLQLEVGVKRGEVQRNIIAQILQHPVAEFLELGVAVVQRQE